MELSLIKTTDGKYKLSVSVDTPLGISDNFTLVYIEIPEKDYLEIKNHIESDFCKDDLLVTTEEFDNGTYKEIVKSKYVKINS